MAPVNLKVLLNVSAIVVGVIIASFGEIKFVLIGFLFQIGGIVFEAIRLVMVQRLLSSAEFKMDPLVSLYYFAPVCAVMNGVTALFLEVPHMTLDHIYGVGLFTLLANAMVAFGLNVSVVFLVSSPSFVSFHLSYFSFFFFFFLILLRVLFLFTRLTFSFFAMNRLARRPPWS